MSFTFIGIDTLDVVPTSTRVSLMYYSLHHHSSVSQKQVPGVPGIVPASPLMKRIEKNIE
jgi:hypothetical protein